MIGAVYLTVLLLLTSQEGKVLRQMSSGWCSPNIANVSGNVTITCIGVNPKALERLNAQLSSKKTELSEKIREANEWAERYHELEKRLADSGENKELSHLAEKYLYEGELTEAGAVLDKILTADENYVDRIAADHYNRGLVFVLQFQALDALPHLARAYQYRPDNLRYGEVYGNVLLAQNDYSASEAVLKSTLDRERRLATLNPSIYDPRVAQTLKSLGDMYRHTERPSEAETSYRAALAICRHLAKIDPAAYQPFVAQTLTSLAALYSETQRLQEAEVTNNEALEIQRQLSKTNYISRTWRKL
jgi:tetratricopeptide (TPR) repeat protein